MPDLSSYIERLPSAPLRDRTLFRADPGRVLGQFFGCTLGSAFQPVADRTGSIVGHQGLARVHGHGGEGLSPWRLLADSASDENLVRLDRLARTVHAVNYFVGANPQWRLFLAVEHRLLDIVAHEHGQFYRQVLAGFGIAPSRVVITLPEPPAGRIPAFREFATNYRLCGYSVAVRVDRPDATTIRAIGSIEPDIVRLRFGSPDFDAWKHAVEASHGLGALVQVTHIEHAEGRRLLATADVDWFQGVAVGPPVAPSRRTERLIRPRYMEIAT